MRSIQKSAPGGAAMHFCKLYTSPSLVLKKVNPKTGTETDFGIDPTDIWEAFSQTALSSAGFPDETYLIVYEDSSGEYFVHPYVQWRPYIP